MTRRFLKAVALLAPPLVFALSAVAQAAEPSGTGAAFVAGLAPVSYTHLTLPTNREV